MMRYSFLLTALLLPPFAQAAVPSDATARAALVGSPDALTIQPATVTLVGPKARQQLIITGTYAGRPRDLTPLVPITGGTDIVSIEGGYLTPRKNGTATLTVTIGGKTAQVKVTVKDLEQPAPVSFRNEVIAALNVGGCNMGACHGTPSGKGGFRLSLRGFDPEADFQMLTRDVLARRGDRHSPDRSLVLLKGLGRVAHEGGARFAPSSLPAQMLRAWLTQGMVNDDPKAATLTRVEVLPGSRLLLAPGRFQQLAVIGHFSDGSQRDVTRLSVFSSSDAGVAEVNAQGLVEFKAPGEVAILVRYLMELQTIRLTYLEPRKDFLWQAPPEVNYVDKHVFAKLKLLSIPPSDLCDDSEFLRRVFLDVLGTLPTADEVRAFLANKNPKKREQVIEELLKRPEYAEYWTMKWSDVFRSSRKTIQIKGTHVFQTWLRGKIRDDVGFDAVVREMITARGSTAHNPGGNYYRIARDAQSLAETTAQLFFGVRMQCAKCHNHPFERWTQDDYYSMAAWFARVRQKNDPRDPGTAPNQIVSEIIFSERGGEVTQPRTGKVMPPKFLGAEVPKIEGHTDRREVLAAWMTDAKNPFFAKNVVNRVWYHLMGKGIVDPVDDFRDSNPSANDELLEALAQDFAAKGFKFKHLIRTIVTSRTYQLSSQTNAFNRDDNKYFSHAITKLLPAEVLLDAIGQATEVPEKFAGMPTGTRAIQLPDGSEINHPFLKTFGQPARELACECERESDSNLAQALQLINGPTVNGKLREPNNRLGKLLSKKQSDEKTLEELYLATLSRLPTPEDTQASLQYLNEAKDRRKAWEDIHWALLNSKEFLFRH
ncbi:MAG: DUF1553 domain-containing protein [Gemmataceae bacterium]